MKVPYDGSEVIPLSHTLTNDDDTQTTCSIVGITDFEELVNNIYPNLFVDHSAYNDRGILAPTNENIENIIYILEKMPGDSHRLLSNDKVVTHDQNMPDVVSVEYLNEVDVPGTPPHKLHLKLGSLISFTRNIILTAVSSTGVLFWICLLYTSPSPRDKRQSRMPSSA